MPDDVNEVDPLPPLQQLYYVVAPSQGTHLVQQQLQQLQLQAHQHQQQQQHQHVQHPAPGQPGAARHQQQYEPQRRGRGDGPVVAGAAAAAAHGAYQQQYQLQPHPLQVLQQPPPPQQAPQQQQYQLQQHYQQPQRYQQPHQHYQQLQQHYQEPHQHYQQPQQYQQQPRQEPQAQQQQPQQEPQPQQQQPQQEPQPQQQPQQRQRRSPSQSSPSSGETSGSSRHSNRLPNSPEGPDIVKVSYRSRVSSVAGKIAHDVRDGRLPRIMVAGNPSISTATKALVQARRFLRPEGQDIAFTPLFRSNDHSRALLELALVLMPVERGTAADNLAQLDNAGGHEARISTTSRHARVGSATARQLRNRGINVLCSVGQEALANSVMACAHAACFLADTGRQMVVQPSHVVLQRGDQELHSIKLVVTFA